jgi:biopolymer transport protein ExbD
LEKNKPSSDKETKDTKDFEYIRHILLLNLIDYFEKKKGVTKNIAHKDTLKLELSEKIMAYSNFTKDSDKKIIQFFGKNYDILSNSTEIKENFSVDISYGSANKFYEKYFNISNNDNNANDEEYNIPYFIKNIKTLIYYILFIVVIAVIIIICLYMLLSEKNKSDTESYSGVKTFAYDVLIPLIILIIFVIYIFIFMSFNTNYNLNVIYGLFDSSYKRDLNDMNNLIIPFIKLHTNNDKKYDKNYYDLYIITNVMASFLYSEENYVAEKYKNIYLINEKADATYSKEETIDYNEFKKYYEEQFTIINNEFEDEFSKIKTESNLKKLYNNINTHIKNTDTSSQSPYTIDDIVKKTFNNNDFTNKFKYVDAPPANHANISNKIVNIILICLELFGKKKDNYKKTYQKFIENFYFEKDKSENFISHKFRFNKSVFGYTYTPAVNSITITGFPIAITIAIENFEDKKNKIINIINNYMNIISLFQYNYILSEALSTQSTQSTQVTEDIKTIILKDAKDVGYNKGEDYLHKYKNRKLISLISNTKNFEKMSFVLAEATFKYSKYTVKYITDLTADTAKTFTVDHIIALTPEAKNALKAVIESKADVKNALTTEVKIELDKTATNTSNNNAVEYVYTNIINNYNINVSNISDNYLENVVKTICYQVDNRDVVMNQESDSEQKSNMEIINKISEAHDNQVTILHKANQCVTYDFATNYMVNLIILGIIYYIGLDNNKIF